ncbi:MAG TPA: helix-turn-helix domain-containing protein [Pirellulales bacterium]
MVKPASNPATLRPMLDVDETADHLRVTPDTVRDFIADGSLIAVNVARGRVARWRIDPDDLEAFKLARRAVRDAQPSKPKFRRPAGLPRYT